MAGEEEFEDDIVLAELDDGKLVKQMHDDLYDGLADQRANQRDGDP